MKLIYYPSYIDNAVINYIATICEAISENDFDEERFKEWLDLNDVEHKTNPSAYVKACFKRELENGRFKPKPIVSYIPNTQELINEMRNKEIVILVDDTDWLNVAWWHILNEYKLPIDECKKLNRSILKYMKTKEFDEYKKLLMNSNTLKPLDIDWKMIEQEASVVHKNWLDIMEELESEE
jgi:hypothetical protein